MNSSPQILRILLIEDNPGDVDLIREMLTETETLIFRIESVARLSEALARLESNNIDLVLLDLGLPDSTGIDTFFRLKTVAFEGPIIILTGNMDQNVGISAVKEGAQDFLVKGQINENILVRSIRYALERGKADVALRQSEEKYRNLVERAHDGIIIVQDGIIKFANTRMAELDGSSLDQLVGTPYTYHVHPSELPRLVDIYRQSMAGEMIPTTYETILLKKDGSPVPAELNAGIITYDGKPADLLIIRDITERKKAEEALLEASLFSRQIIESAQEGIIVYGLDLKYQRWNSYMERLTGLAAAEVLGRHPMEVFPFLHKAEIMAGIDKALAGEVSEAECFQFHIPKTGQSGWASEISAPLKNGRGEIIGVIATVRDITDHLKLEDQLRHAQKMEAVGTLAGGIAHDFNNILNVIMGYGGMVYDSLGADSPVREKMNEVIAAADRAVTLTKRLLVFSRKQVVEVKPVNINVLISGLQKMLVRIIRENIDFKLNLTDKSLVVMADAAQIEQVLMNLTTNSGDAMLEGGRLTIGTGLQELDDEYVKAYGYGKPGRYALITLADTGQGMNEETQNKIFEPFFTTKGIGEGTGLGLAISYGIIKQHEGYIKVYSELGKGTEFKIYLPLIEDATAPGKKPEATGFVEGGKETILVAEDDASLRKLTKIVLESHGYSVITAEDGEDAIAKFMENRESISLALIDMIMPKKNGKEAGETIKKASPLTKILFASGYTMDLIMTKELTESGFDFILKPVLPRDLLKKVREVLDR